MALITRTPMVDDDGSGETGTVVNNDWKQELYNQIDALAASPTLDAWTVVTNTETGTLTNWAPGLSGHTLVFWMGSGGATTLNSMSGGISGQLVTIKNLGGTGAVLFVAHGVSGGAGFYNCATSAPTPIAVNGSATYQYTTNFSGRWELIAHEQGAWITPPYNASDFTAAVGTWTVEAADVSLYTYRLSGRTLMIACYLAGTSISAATSIVMLRLPGGFTYGSGSYVFSLGTISTAGGVTQKLAEAYFPAGTTVVNMRPVDLTNIAVSTNDTTFRFGNINIPVA